MAWSWNCTQIGLSLPGPGQAGRGREDVLVGTVRIREGAQGPDHTSTLDTVNNLGVLYVDQDKLDEAEKMYQRALQGYDTRRHLVWRFLQDIDRRLP